MLKQNFFVSHLFLKLMCMKSGQHSNDWAVVYSLRTALRHGMFVAEIPNPQSFQ
jgi:hypothetical protein